MGHMKNSLSQSTADLRPSISKYRNYESQQNYDNLPFYMRQEKGVKVAKFNLREIKAVQKKQSLNQSLNISGAGSVYDASGTGRAEARQGMSARYADRRPTD